MFSRDAITTHRDQLVSPGEHQAACQTPARAARHCTRPQQRRCRTFNMSYAHVDMTLPSLAVPVLVIEIFCALFVLRDAWLFLRGLHAFRAVATWFRALREKKTDSSDDAEFNEEVDKLMVQIRAGIAQRISYAVWVFSCAHGLLTTLKALVADPSVEVISIVFLLCFCALFTFATLYPEVFFHPRVAPLTHIFAMGCLCLSAFASNSDGRYGRAAAFNTYSMVCSVLCLRFPLVLPTNIVLEACLFASYAREEGSFSNIPARSVILPTVFAFLWKLVLLGGLETMLIRSVKSDVKARSGKCHQSAVHSLLNLLCDVVVDLDEELCFKSEFGKLAGLLMRSAGRVLTGTAFTSLLLDEDDRSRFSNVVQEGPLHEDGSPLPGMVALRLKDAIGNILRVSLFHVPYRSVSGRVHHLVGLIEEADGARSGTIGGMPPAIGLRLGPTPPDATLRPSVLAQLDGSSLRNRTGQGSVRSGRTSRSGSSHRRSQSQPDESSSIEVFLEPGFPIRWVTDSLGEELGLEVGKSFLEYLKDQESEELSQWLTKCAKEADTSSQGFKRRFGELAFMSAVGSGIQTETSRAQSRTT